MTIKRGEVWLASLDPVQGSEQAGTRPVIIFQENTLSQFTTTVITIPLTSNLRPPHFLLVLKYRVVKED